MRFRTSARWGSPRCTTAPALVERVPEHLHGQLLELEQISAGVQRIVDRRAGV